MTVGQLKLYDVNYERDKLGYAEDALLRRLGWTQTSSTPGCFILWERKLDDGRTIVVTKDLAIMMSNVMGLEPPPEEYGE